MVAPGVAPKVEWQVGQRPTGSLFQSRISSHT